MSAYRQRTYFGGFGMMPPMTKALILINVAVFLIQQIAGPRMDYYFGLVPAAVWHGYIWQVVTYMFLHGYFWHIFINMLVLWMFGRVLESVWGSKRFIIYYMVTGIGAGLINAAVMPHSMVPTVGASGAIYGLLLAFGLLFPNQLIFLWFIVPIKAKYMVIGMAVIEFFSGFNPASPVAHFAHLGGMLVGLIYLKWPAWTRRLRRNISEQQSQRRMKVIYNQREEMEKLQAEVDELLDKINRDGIESLTWRDKQRLKEASRKLREWEEQGFGH